MKTKKELVKKKKKMKNSSMLEIALYVHTYFHIAEPQNGQKRCIR